MIWLNLFTENGSAYTTDVALSQTYVLSYINVALNNFFRKKIIVAGVKIESRCCFTAALSQFCTLLFNAEFSLKKLKRHGNVLLKVIDKCHYDILW